MATRLKKVRSVMSVIDVDDEFDDLVPKKQRKPSKPRGSHSPMRQVLILAKTAEEPKRAKQKEPTPELTEESSLDSIQDLEADTSITSIDESFIQPSAQKPKPRARSSSAQPKPKAKATPQQTKGVKGRKPKLAVVPETQVEYSVEEDVEEVEEVAPRRRQGSVLPGNLTRKLPIHRDSVKELQTQGERTFALYKERAEARFRGILS